MKKAEIKKIVLDLGDKEIELSLKQAEKLHEVLDELFKKSVVVPYQPPIIIREGRYWWDYPRPMWTGGKGHITYSSNMAKVSLK